MPGANRTITQIGDLTPAERKVLAEIWRGTLPPAALDDDVRRQLADLYLQAAAQMPPDSAQAVFNEARASYRMGQGPNPGPSVVDFARRNHLKIHRK